MAGIIDVHTHVQPDEAAGAAFLAEVGAAGGDRTGTTDELLALQGLAGISRSVIVPWLPAQDLVARAVATGTDRDVAVEDVIARWRALNAWATAAVAASPARLSCLVGVDPVLMPAALVEEEVGLRLREGAFGLKVAPMFLGVPPDDERMEVVWRLAERHGVPVLAQCGGGVPEHGLPDWGHPARFEAVARAYPQVTLQLAHLGVGEEEALVRLTARHANVVTDTSLRLGGVAEGDLDPGSLVALVRRIGVDRVLFGTNYPLVDPVAYARALADLSLTEDERELVAGANAARALGLERGEPLR